jgi:glycosidase
MQQLPKFILILIMISSVVNSQDEVLNANQINTEHEQFDEFVPQWAKRVVWYQIFPERFRNSIQKNDPTLNSIEGSYPHDNTSPWQVHSWISDWYKLQSYEKKNGNDIWFNIQRRRYGGDLQGIIDKLDYLKELGIGAIYLNPVFWSPSLHKYDAATYHHIDPYFGPDPKGDIKLISTESLDDSSTWVWTSADKIFLELIEEVHNRDMKIIIDGVLNHMGLNSWAFKDVIEKQKKSKFKNWFKIRSWEDPKAKTKFEYEGWYGVKELPELNQDKNGIVDGPKKYIFEITKRWMDPNNNGNPDDGIDGWRLDVAFMIKHRFWKDWRKQVKRINPEAYLTAEIVDSINVIKPYLLGDEFDAVMNYNFLFTTAEYFIDDKSAITTSEFDKKLQILREAFTRGVSYVQQNLFDSHDTQRLLSHIVNRDKYKIRDWGKSFNLTKASNPNYNTRKPMQEEIKLMKLMILFQMTYVGAPYIYYGAEVGMWGANDPDCRKPMVWQDMEFVPEKYLPNQQQKEITDTVIVNNDLFSFYKKMIQIRNENEELQIGTFETMLIDDTNNVYVFSRRYENNEIIVALNKDKSEQTVSLEADDDEYYIDLQNPKLKLNATKGKIEFKIRPVEGRILSRYCFKE